MRTGREVMSDTVNAILASGMTPTKLAAAVGVTERTVYLWKAGKGMPRAHHEAVLFQILSDMDEDKRVEGGR